MKTSTKGLIALINHEGVVLSSYKDIAGVWTIGVGHTAAAGAPRPGPGLRLTLEEAVLLFRADLRSYEDAVNRAVKVPLKAHEFDALVSFHFNTGAIARAEVTRRLNAGKRQKAAAAFMNWTTAGGRKGALTKRRKAERAMFARGDYGRIDNVAVYDRYPGRARAMPAAAILRAAPPDGPVTPPDPLAPPGQRPKPPARAVPRWRAWLTDLFRKIRS